MAHSVRLGRMLCIPLMSLAVPTMCSLSFFSRACQTALATSSGFSMRGTVRVVSSSFWRALRSWGSLPWMTARSGKLVWMMLG